MLETLAPLTERPDRSALLFDIDGTLAQIVSDPAAAQVPDATRPLLSALERRFALVACVSGRRAEEARRMVGLRSLTYVGNHGMERLDPHEERPRTIAGAQEAEKRTRSFARREYTDALRQAGVRAEDKGPIWSFHWRDAPDEAGAHELVSALAETARADGLRPHWGRKVLELRPVLRFDKGTGIEPLVRAESIRAALYGGDDTTDVDAFKKLRELRMDGTLEDAVCVGVRSSEAPQAVLDEADVLVEGLEGFARVLAVLAS